MADGNFGRALQFVPAFALIAVVLFAAYWVLGLVPWPRLAIRDRARDWFGEVVLDQRSGFTMVGLAVISLVSLYLELLLIRWISSEIRIFAFFKSLVLIACFLGFGLGCYVTRSRIRLAYVLVPLLAIVFLIELPWDPRLVSGPLRRGRPAPHRVDGAGVRHHPAALRAHRADLHPAGADGRLVSGACA
jgi:hypothetical protein